jgi:hypothetical protein
MLWFPLRGKLCLAGEQIAAKFPIPRHKEDMLCREAAYNLVCEEGIMAGRWNCCRSESSLEDLLDDEMMAPVLRSSGFDAQGLREMMVETARRIDGRADRSVEEDEYLPEDG